MFVAAGLLWTNASPRLNLPLKRKVFMIEHSEYYGWPWEFAGRYSSNSEIWIGDVLNNWKSWPECGIGFVLWSVTPDLATAIILVIIVAAASEALIRIREARRDQN